MINLESIIEGCRTGNKAMQKELYERYSGRFYALSRRYSDDEETARDILVEGFLKVFENIDKYSGSGSFEGWMSTIFLRTAIMFHRKKMLRKRFIVPLENDNYVRQANIIEQIDIRDALIAALRELGKRERTVFNLVAIEGYSLSEVGKEMGMPEASAKTLYYRARQTLQKLLTKSLGHTYIKD